MVRESARTRQETTVAQALERLADHLVANGVIVAPFMTLWKPEDPLSGEWERTAVRAEDGATFRRASRSWHAAGSEIEHTEDHYRMLIDGQVVAEEVHWRSPATR